MFAAGLLSEFFFSFSPMTQIDEITYLQTEYFQFPLNVKNFINARKRQMFSINIEKIFLQERVITLNYSKGSSCKKK